MWCVVCGMGVSMQYVVCRVEGEMLRLGYFVWTRELLSCIKYSYLTISPVEAQNELEKQLHW